MIVLRLFSKKKKTNLRDIDKTVKSRVPSLGGHLGYKAGREEADRLDEEGKSDIEILEGALEKSKKVGTLVGLGTGSVVGGTVAVLGKKHVKNTGTIVDKYANGSIVRIGGKLADRILKKKGKKPLAGKTISIIGKAGKFAKNHPGTLSSAAGAALAYSTVSKNRRRAEKLTMKDTINRIKERNYRDDNT